MNIFYPLSIALLPIGVIICGVSEPNWCYGLLSVPSVAIVAIGCSLYILVRQVLLRTHSSFWASGKKVWLNWIKKKTITWMHPSITQMCIRKPYAVLFLSQFYHIYFNFRFTPPVGHPLWRTFSHSSCSVGGALYLRVNITVVSDVLRWWNSG